MPLDLRRFSRGAALLLPFLVWGASAAASDLVLESLIASDEDLLRVVPREDGGLGILRAGSVEILSAEGAVHRRAATAPEEVLYLGDDGVTIGVLRHRAGAADFSPTESFELRDPEAGTIWRVGPTEDVTYAISRRRDVVGLSLNVNAPASNRLHFYDERGALAAEVPLPGLLSGRFDAPGDRFYALSHSGGLHAFDPRGHEFWALPDTRLFAVSSSTGEVAAVGGGGLQLVRDGAVVAVVDLGDLLVRRVAIAPDGSRVAIASRADLRVYAGGSLALLWKTTLEDGLALTSIDLASGDGWLVAGVARDLGVATPVSARHPEGEVRAYDARGQQHHVAHLTFPVWNIWTPTVTLAASGRSATITTRRAVYRTALP